MRRNFNIIILLLVLFYLGKNVNANGLPIIYNKDDKITYLVIKRPSNEEALEILNYNLEVRNPGIEIYEQFLRDGSYFYITNDLNIVDRYSYLIIKEENSDIFEIIINSAISMTDDVKNVKKKIMEIFGNYPDILKVIEQEY